jgi:hypothetical protein
MGARVGEQLEGAADRTYIALVTHMDRCAQCEAAGGITAYMCEHGFVLHHRWEVAEYRAAQARAGELEVLS